MTRFEQLGELLGACVLLILMLGFIDVGQGPQYTWWNLILQLGEMF